jgi:hypothetical protein
MPMETAVVPVTLEGKHVRLEPLTPFHSVALAEVGLDEELWRWIPTATRTPAEMTEYAEAASRLHGSVPWG